MLKYLIILCTLSFCVSDDRITGTYQQLLLKQTVPTTAFFAPSRPVNTRSTEFMTHLSENWQVFQTQNWVIQGLWPMNKYSERLAYCRTTSGVVPTYHANDLDDDYKQNLKLKWPVLRVNVTADNYWSDEFNSFGSCVTTNVRSYFSTAQRIFQEYNLETILANKEIYPSETQELSTIIEAIRSSVEFPFYVKCLPALNPREQYLFEVDIYFWRGPRDFDNYYEMHYRVPYGSHSCDPRKSILYPGNRRN